MTVMFMYLIGPVFALGLIAWVNRDKIWSWLSGKSEKDTDPKDGA